MAKKTEAPKNTEKPKGKGKGKSAQPAAKPTLAKITQYMVISLAGLAGFVAYNSGASMEGALTRVVVVILLCTVIGYGLNIFLWLSTHETKPLTSPARRTSAGAARTVGTKLDLVTSDDRDGKTGEAHAPKVTPGTAQAPEKVSA